MRFEANIISAMFGMIIGPRKKPKSTSPTIITGKLFSSKTGPIRRMLRPHINEPVIKVHRISIHFGIVYDEIRVPSMYENGITEKMTP